MRKKLLPLFMLPVVATLSGCFEPTKYESDPVDVQTSKGIVTCQLYTTQMVIWDRSIDRPANMSVREADEYCRRAGTEVKDTVY